MDIKNFIQKLQNLPEGRKKIILWTVVGVLAFIMGFFWIRGVADKLSQINQTLGNLAPEIQTQTEQTEF